MKKEYLIKLLTWSILTALIIVGFSSVFSFGPQFIGKNYVDTDEFKTEMDSFYNQIGPAVLNPLDVEEAKKNIIVTQDEIEAHRNRYGELPDQIANIHEQYEQRIVEAKGAGNKVLEETLIEERDKKTADIQKNFESDEHIKLKILAHKATIIDQYASGIKENDVSLFKVAYELIDIDSGERFSSGNVDVKSAYKKQFNEKDGLLLADSIPGNDYWTEWFHSNMTERTSNGSPYYEEVAPESTSGAISSYKNPTKKFNGVVVVSKKALSEGFLGESASDFNKRKYTAYSLWVLALLSVIVLFTVLKFGKEWVTENRFVSRYDQLKVDVKAAILFVTFFMTMQIINFQASSLLNNYYGYYWGLWSDRIVWFTLLAIAVACITFQLINMIERWKHKGVLEQDIRDSYAVRFVVALGNMFLKKTIGIQMFILLIGFFLAGIGLVVVLLQPMLIVVYFPAVLFLGLPALYIFARRSAYLNKIIVATEAMASGRLQDEIKVEGKSPLAEHAKNLNNLREGVRISMSEQAKSERLKTELITNVSHDLRTPLTSIITYTDLLKSEDLTVEERAKYVDILDKKSQRLKTLIEDLFEVSKMASGNLVLNKQRVDLTQLLQQALAEHEEEIAKTNLDLRISLPESAIIAHIDGQRWWRVLDNLIINAIKYALPGTRVYMTLRKIGDQAEFVVKNITKYELGENVDELFERFKRTDTSRKTEGSGLGLAIAQSIVEMHDGEMKIEVDGDLFKVTVLVPIIY